MTPIKKEARPALMTRGPGDNWKRRSSYPNSPTVQELGERFAERWIDSATRFSSAFYRALTDPPIAAVAEVLQAARDAKLQLEPADFPSAESWRLVSILSGFSESNIRPSIDAILRVAHDAGLDLPGGGGDPAAELRLILESESSAAGLPSWARELHECSRRRRRVDRLYHVLRDELDILRDVERRPMPVVTLVRPTRRPRKAI